jgi:hypothetical protein
MSKRIVISIVVCHMVALGVAATPARAANISVDDGTLVYAAEPSEVNDATILHAFDPSYSAEIPDAAYVYTADAITVGAGCAPAPDAGLVYAGVAYLCTGVTKGVRGDLGDGNDHLEVDAPAAAPVEVDGGPGDDLVAVYDGNDVLVGGAGNDKLFGGHGDDKLYGGPGDDELQGDYGAFADGENATEDLDGAGNDLLDGEDGKDRLVGNGGADVLVGGSGDDLAVYDARKTDLTITFDDQANDGADGERDRIGADVEGVRTGGGNDTVRGGPGAEYIATGRGQDTIDPGSGEDVVEAGPDVDSVVTRDGATDKLGCGDGADTAVIDTTDIAGSDCERVDAPSSVASGQMAVGSLEVNLVMPKRSGRRLLRLSGRLALPPGMDPRLCGGAAVSIEITTTLRRRRTNRQVTTVLRSDCTFGANIRVRLRRAERMAVSASLFGTSVLAHVTSPVRRGRVRG